MELRVGGRWQAKSLLMTGDMARLETGGENPFIPNSEAFVEKEISTLGMP